MVLALLMVVALTAMYYVVVALSAKSFALHGGTATVRRKILAEQYKSGGFLGVLDFMILHRDVIKAKEWLEDRRCWGCGGIFPLHELDHQRCPDCRKGR